MLTYLMLFFWAELIRPRDAATLIIYPSVFRWCSTRPLCVTMWFCVSCCVQTVIGGAAMGRNNNKTAPSHSLLYWGRVQRRMSLQHREISGCSRPLLAKKIPHRILFNLVDSSSGVWVRGNSICTGTRMLYKYKKQQHRITIPCKSP